jgi:trehalose 6-phosphate synthase/phosphatase
MSGERILIVSNRLPVTVRAEHGNVQVIPSPGGLATGLSGPHERSGGLWIGWPGDVGRLGAAQKAALEARFADLRCVPVYLSQGEVARFYDGFSNGVLWPLFHYLLGEIPIEARDFDAYARVNERFADAVAERYQPGDLVWVHDYQLCLVPALLRKRIPDARIGFFLHIPFPSTDVFRTLAGRDAILQGLLGADVVGFHTYTYERHFATSLLRILGIEAQVDSVLYEGREVKLRVYPMGIDSAEFGRIASDPQIAEEARAIRAQVDGARIILGVDRLDYTKGIPRRLLALERLFEREPALRGRVRLVQIAVPSRMNVPRYAEFRRIVDEEVGRINGTFGTVSWSPIHYIFRSISRRHLVALYAAADVMLVTPLRDGMNLVAKEFVASRPDEDGVLVLSEFAGAAAEMGEAMLVNPYDIDQVAQAMKDALSMPERERRARMRGLRRRVLSYDVHTWVRRFLEDLAAVHGGQPPREVSGGVASLTMRIVQHVQHEDPFVLLLDYDGTLVPFARVPHLAAPDEELCALLRALASRPRTRVHLVSGRDRGSLEEWFGGLPIGLHAEHGFWSRVDPRAAWVAAGELPGEWKAKARSVLDAFADRTPGAFVEEKTAAVAWHYRLADAEFGALQAKELRLHLANAFANAPVEVLVGEKVVEVRPHGVSKAQVVRLALAEAPPGAAALVMGDDRTDEEMFAAAPEDALTVHVGHGGSRARFRVPSHTAARAVLRALL